jgi:hypothetical protein
LRLDDRELDLVVVTEKEQQWHRPVASQDLIVDVHALFP